MVAIAVPCVLACLLAGHLAFLKFQLRRINAQLQKRLRERTRQPVSLGLLDGTLNSLALNINQCLRAEEDLRLAVVREETQYKEMVANISHDLRTPLTAIKGYQQLMERGQLPEGQREKLAVARKHADALGDLIEEFFSYSCLLSGGLQPKPERLNLTNLTAECLASSVAAFESRRLAVRFEDPGPVLVYADRETVTRILQNLIRNAVQHANGDITVKLCAGQRAELSFGNAVKNADAVDVSRLFERFYAADQAGNESAGLGLSIVKALARQAGGGASATLADGFLEIRVELPVWDKSAP